MDFISVEVLYKTFEVKAKFYNAEVKDEKFLMRREARISRIGHVEEKIDATVVMINPGSCLPEVGIQDSSINEMKMIPARSDPTQHQLMRLMYRMEWNQLVIINLSDICEGNLSNFKAIEKKFISANQPHSIFQSENSLERTKLISNSEHLIFAWGASDNAKRLAKEFGLYSKGRPLAPYQKAIALIHPEKSFPLHPRPALMTNQIKWIEEIIPLLKKEIAT